MNVGGGGDSGSPGDPILATLLRVETAREGRCTRETQRVSDNDL